MKAEDVRSILQYVPETGLFIWKVSRGSVKAGKATFGSPAGHGYRQIRVFGKLLYAHRLAWLIMTGEMPQMEIDHKNGNRSDNRWSNLRHVDPSTNMENEQRARGGRKYSRLMGAFYRKDTEQWFSQIAVKGKIVRLGQFSDELSAHQAYLKAKRELHAGCTI